MKSTSGLWRKKKERKILQGKGKNMCTKFDTKTRIFVGVQ